MEQSIKRRQGVCLKAVEGDKIIGIVHAQHENPINGKEGTEKWVITNIAVDPKSTSMGIGSKLLNSIEQSARDRRAKKIYTHTNQGDNQVFNFYKKSGYQLAGSITDYYYDGSAVFLLKHLAS